MAHRSFIAYTKRRKPRNNVRRKAIRSQLGFLRRNINFIDHMLLERDENESPFNMFKDIPAYLTDRYITIKKIYEQQDYMYESRVKKVDDRIVSVSQPHIRPIVRGKAGKSVEFGAKISMSLCDGFCFIDRLSWDGFNESKDLIDQVEKYKERHGYYPESVHADKIYQTRDNRKFCKGLEGIRLSGLPLGRPPVETEENKEELVNKKKQRYQDDVDRIAIEGRFGVAKRRFGMGLIKTKLKETSETAIHLSVLVMNLEKICDEELVEIRGRFKLKRKEAC